jgi:hypothetical protein
MEFSHQENLRTDRYPHCDDFRHRATDKGGLSKEEQWAAIRMGGRCGPSYWLAEYFSISHEILRAPKQYYRSFLHTETDGNDLNYFLLHQLEVIGDSIRSFRKAIRTKQEDAESLSKQSGLAGVIRGSASWRDIQAKWRMLPEKQKGDFFEGARQSLPSAGSGKRQQAQARLAGRRSPASERP